MARARKKAIRRTEGPCDDEAVASDRLARRGLPNGGCLAIGARWPCTGNRHLNLSPRKAVLVA